MRKLKWIVLALAIALVVAATGFVIWANTPLAPAAAALAALQSDAAVTVETGEWIIFRPAQSAPTTGFIFYPGGRVDARAYAPPLRDLAARGYLVALVPMPLNLAVFGVERGAAVIQAFPDIQRWAIGGHSLGGAMAARFVQSRPDAVQGLVLWASYPDIDLSGFDELMAVSIYGTLDAVASRQTVEDARERLPANTVWAAIEGGNHSGFGDYGLQPGDAPATLNPAAQWAQVADATAALLARLGEG